MVSETTEKIAELVADDTVITVDLVTIETDSGQHFLSYVVRGPGSYVAHLPHCGCDRPGCAGLGWGRQCKTLTDPGGKYTHGRQACHGSPCGYHQEHANALARTVLNSFQTRKTKPGTVIGGTRIDPNRPRTYNQFVQLDGEETVGLYPLKSRGYGAESETMAARLVCNSRWCVVDRRAWQRIVVLLPGTEYDPGPTPYPGYVADDAIRIEGRDPYEVRNEHIEWHRENFAVHPRVALDRWVHDHAMTTAPEPDRAELDRQLAIAKAEREVMISKKIGARVKLKPSAGSYATTGVIREVYGEGKSALFEVDTVDQTGYRKTEHLVRNQFTLAGTS